MAIPKDITIEQGITFELPARVKKNGIILDVTGYTGVFQVRDKPSSEVGSIVLGTATVTVIDGPTGLMLASIAANITKTYTWSVGIYEWKIKAPTGEVYRLAKGNAFLDKEYAPLP